MLIKPTWYPSFDGNWEPSYKNTTYMPPWALNLTQSMLILPPSQPTDRCIPLLLIYFFLSYWMLFFFMFSFSLTTEMLSEWTKTLKQQQQFNYLSRECNRSMKLKKMNLEFLRKLNTWINIKKVLQGNWKYKLHKTTTQTTWLNFLT